MVRGEVRENIRGYLMLLYAFAYTYIITLFLVFPKSIQNSICFFWHLLEFSHPTSSRCFCRCSSCQKHQGSLGEDRETHGFFIIKLCMEGPAPLLPGNSSSRDKMQRSFGQRERVFSLALQTTKHRTIFWLKNAHHWDPHPKSDGFFNRKAIKSPSSRCCWLVISPVAVTCKLRASSSFAQRKASCACCSSLSALRANFSLRPCVKP